MLLLSEANEVSGAFYWRLFTFFVTNWLENYLTENYETLQSKRHTLGKMGGFISHLWWGGDPDIVNDFSDLSRRDVYVVQKTWAIVYTNVVEIGVELFKRLFRVCPETKLFFKMIRDVPEADFGKSHLFTAHVINLMSSLNLAITNLNQPEVSAALMNTLGESHGKRKIQEKHFIVLKDVMLAMLKELLKPDEATLNSWCKTVDFLYKHIFETLLIS